MSLFLYKLYDLDWGTGSVMAWVSVDNISLSVLRAVDIAHRYTYFAHKTEVVVSTSSVFRQ